MGLQRHLKVAGIFARLTLRDGKAKYLADTPRFIHYIRTTAGRYRELRPYPVLTVAGKVEVGAPTTCVRTAIRADSPLTSNWTSRIRNSLLAYAVWWNPWASRRRSITDAHR